jgi:DNA repair protein RecO (recombination protein O)
MPTKSIEAIIISRKDLGEADRLITAFSRTEGKIKIAARGSRKIKSKLSAHVEPFSIGRYFLAEGKSFYILAGAEAVSQNLSVTDDIDLYKDISYLFEILNMVTVEGVPNEPIYDLTKEVLKEIYKVSPETRQIIMRYFEYKVLEHSGYLPSYNECQKCGQKLTEAKEFQGSFEGVLCENCGTGKKNIELNTLKVIRLFDRYTLAGVLKINGIEDYNSRLKEVISPKLYDILPRIPNSQKL